MINNIDNNTNVYKIITDDNLMETKQHGNTLYPFQFYYDDLKLFDFHCIEWHWHEELEFVYIEKGPIFFLIGEKQFELPQNSGLFINSKVLHRFFSEIDGIVPNVVCSPFFLAQENSYLYTQYIQPVISSSLDYIIFSPEISWQADILSLFREIIYYCQHTENTELLISSALLKIWHLLYQNNDFSQENEKTRQKNGSLARLQLMMQYIHANYEKAISLDHLCNHVHISKSTSLNLFHQYLHTTPINYLIKYRLQAATRLLLQSDKNISQISADCGFDNIDYFCKTFKKHYGITPSQYRKNKSEL